MENTVRAIVQKVNDKGPHGPYAVAMSSDSLIGSVTFSLEPTVWREDDWPEAGSVVLLSKLRQKRAGWRAKAGRFYTPSDEQRAKETLQMNVRQWYDDKWSIASYLSSLKDLHFVIDARCEAGYQRQERLDEFYIFGRYYLDSCGNCSKLNDRVDDAVLADLPVVLTSEEFWELIRERLGEKTMLSFAVNGGNLPLPELKCAHCGKTWEIENCHDTVVWHTTEVFPLTDFVGRTLGDVKREYELRTDAIYRMQRDTLVRNDRFIDLSPKYPNTTKDWEKSIVKNERGWVRERDGIDDNYIVQSGDEGFFNVWKYFHSTCNREHLQQEEERRFREIFVVAGFQTVTMTSRPNEYCPCDHCASWFDVNTEFGVITIGWRKRVINIDWKWVTGKNPKGLFASEDVTNGDFYIHAWGWDKAQEYLTRIYRELSK